MYKLDIFISCVTRRGFTGHLGRGRGPQAAHSRSRSSTWSLPFRFPDQNVMNFRCQLYMLYAPPTPSLLG